MYARYWLRNYKRKCYLGTCVFYFLKLEKVLFLMLNLFFLTIFNCLISVSEHWLTWPFFILFFASRNRLKWWFLINQSVLLICALMTHVNQFKNRKIPLNFVHSINQSKKKRNSDVFITTKSHANLCYKDTC